MKKSLYSLMLDDGVVAAIDRLAYLSGTNRSHMVNRILAEYASYTTPEEKIRQAFSRISAMLDGHDSLRLAVPPSETMLSLRSALLYKYHPTVRYSVELYRGGGDHVGELRVSLRTQSASLIRAVMQFYRLFEEVERAHLGPVICHAEEGRYTRLLTPRLRPGQEMPAPERLGETIATYLRTLDAALKAAFRYLDDPDAAKREIERIYIAYLQEATLVI